ncbi:galactose-1-phosphate uridylyltransferase [uncultured Jatrophihabitans sp.]|uniref:galactose-1-phosphate uridylyltransferase n=1 Tax=uncultured Jatrophihabitans sp. TaxID=1610747 RepID=UPI0035CC900E
MSQPPYVTRIELSDGRELVYYDETPGLDRAAQDKRDLDRTEVRSELRRDPTTDQWVVIASHRQSRTYLPADDACPLDPTTPANLTEIPVSSYDVVVFENRFPSLVTDGVEPHPLDSDELFPRRPGVGRCEVVCFSDNHDASLGSLPPRRIRTIVDAWADRTRALSALPGVEQVFPFENRGQEIGVTLTHPHGQIYAYPFVTPRTDRQLRTAGEYAERTGRNLFADVLAAERTAGERVVASNEHWTAFVPEAARWPMEVHLYPHRQLPDIAALDDAERDAFAHLYLDVLHGLDALYDMPLPYISAWHQAPVRQLREHAYLHLELFSIRRTATKLKYLAGSESGMEVFVNDVVPEDMAQRLRDAIA